MKTREQIISDFENNVEESFSEMKSTEGYSLKGFRNIPEGERLFIGFPRIQSMMTGVLKLEISNAGKIIAHYEDDSTDECFLDESDIDSVGSIFGIIGLIQSRRESKVGAK